MLLLISRSLGSAVLHISSPGLWRADSGQGFDAPSSNPFLASSMALMATLPETALEFSSESLPELLHVDSEILEQPWFLRPGAPCPAGAKGGSKNRITALGKSLCWRFFKESDRRTDRDLPLHHAYHPGQDTEVDAFIEWSGLDWDQLKQQSKNFLMQDRIAKPFDEVNTQELLTRMDLPSLVQAAHALFQSGFYCSTSKQGEIVFAFSPHFLAFSHSMQSSRHFNYEVNLYIGKLSVELMKHLAKKQKHVDELEAAFAGARRALKEEFHCLKIGSLRHMFDTDNRTSKLDRIVAGVDGSSILVDLTFKQKLAVTSIQNAFLSAFELCVYKLFIEKVYVLDRPVSSLAHATVDALMKGPKGKVLYYICGWIIRKMSQPKNLTTLINDYGPDPDGSIEEACVRWFESVSISSESVESAGVTDISSLVSEREVADGLVYCSLKFFVFMCKVEMFLGKRLNLDNLRFFGGQLLQNLEQQIFSSEEHLDAFQAILISSSAQVLTEVLLKPILHVSSPHSLQTSM